MSSLWSRLRAWAYALSTGVTWGVWAVVALVAALVLTVVPSPWDWVATVPFAVFGYVLFDAQARRERDRDHS